MHANNWNNFPKIKTGDKVRITWDERFYGMQEDGEAFSDSGTLKVRFGTKEVNVELLRENSHIERTEVIS